jgi:hypothetical protein
MLIAEELLLISLDDEDGRDETSYSGRGYGLAGALLLDLSLAGALELRDKRIVATGEAPAGQPLLAEVLAVIRDDDKERLAKSWIQRLPRRVKPLRERVAVGLVEQGVLREEHSKLLGLFGRTRYPAADPGPERELRARLISVLVDGAEPDPRTALLCSLLVPMQFVGKVVPKQDRREATKRAKALAEQSAIGSGLATVVSEVQAAVMISVTAAVSASAASVATG